MPYRELSESLLRRRRPGPAANWHNTRFTSFGQKCKFDTSDEQPFDWLLYSNTSQTACAKNRPDRPFTGYLLSVCRVNSGVEPSLMGTGPIPAVTLALQRAGLSPADMDVIESSEAFAAQSLGVCRRLDLYPS